MNGGFQQQLGRMNSSLSSSSVRMEFQSIDNEVPCTLTFDNICYAVSATDKGGKKQVCCFAFFFTFLHFFSSVCVCDVCDEGHA